MCLSLQLRPHRASHGAGSSDSEATEATLCSVRLGVKGVPVTPHWGGSCCVPALTPQGNCGESPQAGCSSPSSLHSPPPPHPPPCTAVFLSPRGPIRKLSFLFGEVMVGSSGPQNCCMRIWTAVGWGVGWGVGWCAGRRGKSKNLPVEPAPPDHSDAVAQGVHPSFLTMPGKPMAEFESHIGPGDVLSTSSCKSCDLSGLSCSFREEEHPVSLRERQAWGLSSCFLPLATEESKL